MNFTTKCGTIKERRAVGHKTISVDIEQPKESTGEVMTYLDAIRKMDARDFAEFVAVIVEDALQVNFGITGTVTEANKEELIELFNSPLKEVPNGSD